ncbi:hypothetical protein A0H81_13749 [Grifola frondosa]|uniref:Uncharacterized protein n=1 Tax=Grifola frondosa TaxID=5627 RepID=A0A1C7LNR0_GRIFR|nr:hypothetical protein A0H81_13749 [Grifola frondosa]
MILLEREQPALTTPRIPLADLDLEETPKPIHIRRQPRVSDYEALPGGSSESSALSPAPQGSPLAQVINAINLSAMTISDSSPSFPSPLSTLSVGAHEENDSCPCPEISVCSPSDTPITSPKSAEFTTASTLQAVLPGSATLRPTTGLAKFAADDPRRTSIDLHSSFQLQMQCEELSFDLLNDKISFLGHGQDSFWPNMDDPSLDFEEERAMVSHVSETHNEKDISSPSDNEVPAEITVEDSGNVKEDELEKVPYADTIGSPPFQPAGLKELSPAPISCESSVSMPIPQSPITKKHASPIEHEPRPSNLFLPSSAPEITAIMASPAPPPVLPSVPALRITKKTWKLHGHSIAGSSNSITNRTSIATSVGTSRRLSVSKSINAAQVPNKDAAMVELAPAQVTASKPVTVIRGVQRPPIAMHASGTVVIGIPTSERSSQSQKEKSRMPSKTDGGRFAAAGVQRPKIGSGALQNAGKEKSRVTSLVTRPAPSAGPMPSRLPSANVSKNIMSSGARPPSRFGTSAPGVGTSALPRPASRLPTSNTTGTSSAGASKARGVKLGDTNASLRGGAVARRAF